MLASRALRWALGIVVVFGIAVWLAFPAIVLRAPGIIGRIADPIGPNQKVVWQAGPETPSAPPGERPPNVIVIVADDLGYNDLTFAGGGVARGAAPTPRIDSLARDGVVFRAGYTGNATCAPSRAAIMTGRYPTRFGFEFTPAPKVFMRLIARFRSEEPRPPIYHAEREDQVPPMAEQGLPPSEITLAELLRERGYHTIALGKWHLGESKPLQPAAQGFDEFVGFLAGGAMFLDRDDPNGVSAQQDFDPIDRFLWANLGFAVRVNGGPRFTPASYMTDYLADEAVNAIGANRHRPFLMYLAFNAPHTPLQATRADYEALAAIPEHRLRVYAAMIRALDRGVGKVLDALDAHGLAENTLVLFTSDNGGADYIGLPEINRPFRGWKMTFFEGGVRTPFFARWPARLPAGASVAAPVAHVDIFATAAAAAGAPLPSDRPIDGVNLLPYARGQATGDPHESLYWRSGGYKSLLAGGWKLQVSERRTWLFDLRADPTERVDRSADAADKRRELEARLAALDAEMVAPAWPSLIEGPIAVDRTLEDPPEPDDELVWWPN